MPRAKTAKTAYALTPNNLAKLIRQRTRDGAELVEIALDILRENGVYRHRNIPLRIKVDLLKTLMEFGYGRPYAQEPEREELLGNGVVFVPWMPREPEQLPTPPRNPAMPGAMGDVAVPEEVLDAQMRIVIEDDDEDDGDANFRIPFRGTE